MSKFMENIKAHIPNDYFADAELMNIFPKSANSRYGLVKRAIASGDIVRVRRGLYVLSKKHQRTGIDLFELAHTVYAPSYISLESALSYHRWIPEGIPTSTSVCRNRSKEFTTPLGVFSYSRIPKFNFIGVERIGRGRSLFLMAEPTKALIDLVCVYRKDWEGISPLLSSLRIEPEDLEQIDKEILSLLKQEKLSRRVDRFIDGLMKDLEP